VASVQLVDSNGVDVTRHLALYPHYSTLVHIHLFETNGQEVGRLTDAPVQLGVTFAPSSLATAQTDSALLWALVTPTAASNTPGTWTIHLFSPATMTNKVFGPFDILIH